MVRYDHRDTGRSSRVHEPYAIQDLAADAVAVLDALGVERAHAVGMSLGGTLVQLLLLDLPARLRSATVFATSALGAGLANPAGPGADGLPGPDPRLLAMWGELGAERDEEHELAWRVEHWRLLDGAGPGFDAEEFRALERRVAEHAGTWRSPSAHALADPSGLDRAAELAGVRVPVLVVEAPLDPVNPPPHAQHLADAIGSARLVTIPGMGHALSGRVLGPLAEAVCAFTAEVDAA